MASISPEFMGLPPQLSNDELRRLALKMNEGLKKISKAEAEAEKKELDRILQLEKQKMKEYEQRFKK